MVLDVQVRRIDPGITMFELKGRLTLGNRLTEVEHAVRKEIAEGCRKLVIDLGQLEHLDSAGVGMLVMCAGQMEQAGGTLRVAGAHPRGKQVFSVTRSE